MHLVVCSDAVESDGAIYNTAFLLGRDGKEIGRYHKVCPTWSESGTRARGDGFPVFPTRELGTVGLAICYDLVMPETARCLALAGADIIFFPTMGGAAIGDDDIGVQALRVRAVENFVWLVVAHRGGGAMVISPKGKIIATAEGPDGLAIAVIDPHGEREGGDALNSQRDMRARLFRERNPAAFGLLSANHPPVLEKVSIEGTREEAARVSARVLTVGEGDFKSASELVREGRVEEARAAFERLRHEYAGSWIDRRSAERLAQLPAPQREAPSTRRAPATSANEVRHGIAAGYPGDAGISRDPRVIFAEDFEEPSFEKLAERWEDVGAREAMSFTRDVPPGSASRQSLLMDRREGPGPKLYRRLRNADGGWGFDRVYARYYVRFAADSGEIHHFGTCLGGNHPPTPWPQVRAGQPPDGARGFWSGIEPFGDRWAWDYYTYWCDMRGSPPRGQTWGNSFIRDDALSVEKGRWICIEQMIHVNDVGDTNGEQALWIDGRQVSHLGKGFPKGLWMYDKFNPGRGGRGVRWNHDTGGPENLEVPTGGAAFEGFRWRTHPELKVNFLWLYVYTQKPAGHRIRVWFDDVVLATEYIGPIQPMR
jgi:hypothetical protein